MHWFLTVLKVQLMMFTYMVSSANDTTYGAIFHLLAKLRAKVCNADMAIRGVSSVDCH
jgi:hypothetical protein